MCVYVRESEALSTCANSLIELSPAKFEDVNCLARFFTAHPFSLDFFLKNQAKT